MFIDLYNKIKEKEDFNFEDIEIELEAEPSMNEFDLDIDEANECPVWQALNDKVMFMTVGITNKIDAMNKIYEQGNKIFLYAHILGQLNQCLIEGGFELWVTEGYGFAHEIVRSALRSINTESTQKMLNMIDDLDQYLKLTDRSWIEGTEEEGKEFAGLLDAKYREIDNQFCLDVEAYFRRRLEQENLE